jgi:hypothetical protein
MSFLSSINQSSFLRFQVNQLLPTMAGKNKILEQNINYQLSNYVRLYEWCTFY